MKGEISTVENDHVGFEVEWRIKDFLSLQHVDGSWYGSPPFTFNNRKWCLLVLPNGWGGSSSYGMVNFRLRLEDRYTAYSANLNIALTLKTENGLKRYERHAFRVFNTDLNDNQGLPGLVPRVHLEQDQSNLLPSGVLTVTCILNVVVRESAGVGCSYFGVSTVRKRPFEESLDDHESKKRRTKGYQCMVPMTLLVQGLDEDTQKEDLEYEFGKFGNLTQVWVPRNPSSCALIDFENEDDARKAMNEMNGAMINGAEIWVEATRFGSEKDGRQKRGTSSTSSVAVRENKVLQDLKSLFVKREDCDVILNVQGKEFPAHRTILIARSRVFASNFRHNTKEKDTRVIDIEDCDPSFFKDFLTFLYCGDVDVISVDNVFSLFKNADKYMVDDLREKCLEFMKANLSVDTFCGTITFALLHSETELVESATDFFAKNMRKIIVTTQWKQFLKENTEQGNDLFVKALVSDNDSGM